VRHVTIRTKTIFQRQRMQPILLLSATESAMSEILLESTLVCPVCGFAKQEIMPTDEAEPLNLEGLFAALDKFCNHILSLPAAANRPEIKQHLDFVAASKEKLTLALAEQFAHAQVHRERLADLAQTMKQKQEAHRRQMEELTRPSPPSDGNALGRELLMNLGLAD